MIKKFFSMALAACLLLSGTAALANDGAQPLTVEQTQSEWGNPVTNIVDGWTEFDSGEHVAVSFDSSENLTLSEFYYRISGVIEGYPLTAYYEYLNPETGNIELTSKRIAQSDAMGAYVLDGNLPSDYFQVDGNGYITFLKTGTVAVDFYVQFYNETPWGGIYTDGYMMADIVIH